MCLLGEEGRRGDRGELQPPLSRFTRRPGLARFRFPRLPAFLEAATARGYGQSLNDEIVVKVCLLGSPASGHDHLAAIKLVAG
jgi:hypothetical protein